MMNFHFFEDYILENFAFDHFPTDSSSPSTPRSSIYSLQNEISLADYGDYTPVLQTGDISPEIMVPSLFSAMRVLDHKTHFLYSDFGRFLGMQLRWCS
jgi:hypothetical protein